MENYRGIVLSQYKSITDFAVSIGWTRNKASRIVNGKQEPDAKDMERMAEVLEINTPEKFMDIFFDKLSTKWTPD